MRTGVVATVCAGHTKAEEYSPTQPQFEGKRGIKMKRTLFIALALVALLAAAANATVPPVVWFYDDFNYEVDNGTPLANTDPWMLSSGGNYNLLYNGEVRMTANGQACCNETVAHINPDNDIQIMHIVVRGGLFSQDPNIGNFAYIYMSGASYDIGFWYGWSDHLTPRYDSVVGTAVDLTDGLKHDLDIVYNAATGLTQWFGDGELVLSATQDTGWSVDKPYIDTGNRGVADIVWIDEMAIGTVPEPSSLLALSIFGAGMLGYIKRRK